ncbi:another transcription unit protein [Nothobranchius furzeri]|nr:neurofilament heavy polypeptide [Nothobranchius furzeri]
MTCGLGLGILLICIVQIEHVCSLVERAQSYQNSNVGLPLADGLRQFGSYPQNQLRQGLISPRTVQSSSSSFNAEPVVKSGYGQGLFTRSHTQALPQPARSSVRKVKSSLLKFNRQSPVSPRASAPAERQSPVSPRASAPAERQSPVSPRASAPAERQSPVSPRASAPAEPKRSFGLSIDIASGSAVSQRSEKLKDLEQKGLSAQREMPQPRKHLSSSPRSAQSPSRERYSLSSASRQSLADSRSNSPSGENYPFRLASLPTAARKTSYATPKTSYNKQMSSSAVLFGPVAPGPRERYTRMQTFARGPAKRVVSSRRSGASKAAVFSPRMESSKPFEGQGSYRPMSQVQIYQPSSVSKGVYNMAFPRSSRVDSSVMGFAPVTVHDIPNRLGGSSIRRLKEPDQKGEAIRKLQPYTPHLQRGRSGWSRIQVHKV